MATLILMKKNSSGNTKKDESYKQSTAKEKHDNLNVEKKEQLMKHQKKGKKSMHYNLDDKQKEHLKIKCNKRKKA